MEQSVIPDSIRDEGKKTAEKKRLEIMLPKELEAVKKATEFPSEIHRWYTNEEVAAILIAFDKHEEWYTREVKTRPPSGSMLLLHRKKVKYRQDGYCWKKRKDGRTMREDHMKLKVQGVVCIYGCYVHSAILPTFHRRSYWLLQNPDTVLLHYLNVPLSDENKVHMATLSQCGVEKTLWERGELIEQLRPMYASMKHTNPSNTTDEMVEETMNSIATHLLATQSKPRPCPCPVSTCTDLARCRQRILSPRGSVPANSRRRQAVPASGFAQTVAPPVEQQGGVIRQVTAGHTPLILNLSQLQGSNGLVILSSQTGAPFLVNSAQSHQQPQSQLQPPAGQGQGRKKQGQGQRSGQGRPKGQRKSRSQTVASESVVQKSDGLQSENAQVHHVQVGVGQLQGQNQNQGHMYGQTQGESQGQGQSLLSATPQPVKVANTNSDDGFDIFSLIDSPCLGRTDVSEHTMDVSHHDSAHSFHDNSMATTMQQSGFHANQIKLEKTVGGCDRTTAAAAGLHDNLAGLGNHGNHHHHHHHTSHDNSQQSTVTSTGVSAVEELVAELNMKNDLETFDPNVHLTHDDIQEALSDALGMQDSRTSAETSDTRGADTLANSSIDEALRNSLVSPHGTDLNFEAFDILDLADIDNVNLTSDTSAGTSASQGSALTTSVTMTTAGTPSAPSNSCTSCMTHTHNQSTTQVKENRAGIANITDFSPEWAYTEGGSKVLVAGPWYSTTSPYTILFEGIPVPATLVQSGVLRCYTPAHTPGVATLQVSCEGFVISNTCYFEFRARESSQQNSSRQVNWFAVREEQLKMALLSRFTELEKHLEPLNPASKIMAASGPRARSRDVFEDKLLEHCERLSQRNWARGDELLRGSYMGLTLLHLVAALGYSRLINTLIKWRSEKQCLLLDCEVDALNVDQNMCTPLMWACALGKSDTALVLYHWNSGALGICNKDGFLPLSVAKKFGHLNILYSIEGLELARLNPVHTSTPERSLPSPSANQSEASQHALGKVTFTPPALPQPVHVRVAQARQDGRLQEDIASQLAEPGTANWSTPLSDLTIQIPPSPPYSTGGSTRKHDSLPASLQCTPARGNEQSRDLDLYEESISRRLRLMKRTSVEVLPDYPAAPFAPEGITKCSKTEKGAMADAPTPKSQIPERLRTASSDPHLVGLDNPSGYLPDPMISVSNRDLNSPLGFMNTDAATLGQTNFDLEHIAMETDSPRTSSPIFSVDDDDSSVSQMVSGEGDGTTPPQMMALANQIIAAMPERIKLSPCRGDDLLTEEISSRRDRSSSYGSFSSCSSTATPPCATTQDSGISTPLEGMAFEEYRYPDLGTPASSLSPASSCLHSPYSFSLDSFPPTTEEFTEYFNAPNFYMEKDFSQLTLSDEEQRRLYEAAKIIQSFYRKYKDQKELQRRQRQKEIEAAILIQSYYRRYKQYMYYKKMSQAAILIQSQFRTYYAQKRFKLSREAATIIQNRYRAYKQQERYKKSRNAAVLIQQRFRSHYQRKRNQQDMARKVQEMVDEPNLNLDSNDTAATDARIPSTSAKDGTDTPAPPGESQEHSAGGATSGGDSETVSIATKDNKQGSTDETTKDDTPSLS